MISNRCGADDESRILHLSYYCGARYVLSLRFLLRPRRCTTHPEVINADLLKFIAS
jgi:hypothetical protein